MPKHTDRDSLEGLEGHFTPSRESGLSSRPLPHAMKLPGYGDKRFMAMDPEEHIERTSNAPGARGMSGSYERAQTTWNAQSLPNPDAPAYGGSVDARSGGTEHHPTWKVWRRKTREARAPANATREGPNWNPNTSSFDRVPVHGRGLYDSLMSGESLRSPVHTIIDPAPPIYGPIPFQSTGGSQKVYEDDIGGFGHHEMVQWEGHHRVAAAAEKQRTLREAGDPNWQVNVPYEIHMGGAAAAAAKPRIAAGEAKANKLHALRQMIFGSSTGEGRTSESASPPTPKRRRS